MVVYGQIWPLLALNDTIDVQAIYHPFSMYLVSGLQAGSKLVSCKKQILGRSGLLEVGEAVYCYFEMRRNQVQRKSQCACQRIGMLVDRMNLKIFFWRSNILLTLFLTMLPCHKAPGLLQNSL